MLPGSQPAAQASTMASEAAQADQQGLCQGAAGSSEPACKGLTESAVSAASLLRLDGWNAVPGVCFLLSMHF